MRHALIPKEKLALTRVIVDELDPRLNYGESDHRTSVSVRVRTLASDSVVVRNGHLKFSRCKTIQPLEDVRHVRLVSEHEDVVL